jgi:hypothetical protein
MVVLPRSATVNVRVPTLVTSDLIANVSLLNAGGAPLESFGLGMAVKHSWPMEGGVATISGVPPGTWSVLVEAPDGNSYYGEVQVSAAMQVSVIVDKISGH